VLNLLLDFFIDLHLKVHFLCGLELVWLNLLVGILFVVWLRFFPTLVEGSNPALKKLVTHGEHIGILLWLSFHLSAFSFRNL
jgi:hypothetical protein